MRYALRTMLLPLFLTAGGTFAAEAPKNDDLLSLGAEALADTELQEQRAGEGLSLAFLTEADLQGNVAGNTVYGGTTGNNIISDNAFQNAYGFPVVIQNSGNNVLLQNSVIINLAMTP